MNHTYRFALVVFTFSIQSVYGDDTAAINSLEKAGAVVTRDSSTDEKRLTSLSINLRTVTPEMNRALKDVEYIPSISFLGAGNTEISIETLQALKDKRSLARFSIGYARISDEAATIIGSLKSLRQIEFQSQNEISTKGLSEILSRVDLTELTLSDRLVSDDILSDVSRLPRLKELTLRSVFVSDDGILSIRKMKSLNSLRIFLGDMVTDAGIRQLTELHLNDLEITYLNPTDEKLKSLRKLGALTELRLINAVKVTDEAVPYLIELTELKRLDIADAKLSKSGSEQLKSGLPACSIKSMQKRKN